FDNIVDLKSAREGVPARSTPVTLVLQKSDRMVWVSTCSRITREEPSDEKQTFGQHRSAVGRNGNGVGAERTKRRTRVRARRPKPGCTGRGGGTGSTGSAE